MSLAYDYRAELNAKQAARRARLWSVDPTDRLIAATPNTAVVGEQNEHVIAWRIERAVAQAEAAISPVMKSWLRIAKETISGTSVSMTDLVSARRVRPVALVRHEVMYRLATETTMGYPQIGRVLGNRDHTTIVHGVRMHAARHGLRNPSPCTGKKAGLYAP